MDKKQIVANIIALSKTVNDSSIPMEERIKKLRAMEIQGCSDVAVTLAIFNDDQMEQIGHLQEAISIDNNPRALYDMARIYYLDERDKENPDQERMARGKEYLYQAAIQFYSEAMVIMGTTAFDERRDYAEAFFWLFLAGTNAYTMADMALPIVMHKWKMAGYPKEYMNSKTPCFTEEQHKAVIEAMLFHTKKQTAAETLEHLMPMVEQGVDFACQYAGYLYRFKTIDMPAAIRCYEPLAAKKNPQAMRLIGATKLQMDVESGALTTGEPLTYEQGYVYFKDAMELGDPISLALVSQGRIKDGDPEFNRALLTVAALRGLPSDFMDDTDEDDTSDAGWE